jgi:phenylacetate-CoA ligase
MWESSTSGSTGAPVRVLKTGLTDLMWRAVTLRDHVWHRRDLSAKLAAIRQGAPDQTGDNWGAATWGINTGPVAMLSMGRSADAQLDWLRAQRPQYLLTYPSNAAEIARRSMERREPLESLLEVRTLGELLAPETRELLGRAGDVPVIDMYSADEVGYIGLQCPANAYYHVQGESILVEVLDEHGAPCGPGETGRVVLTSLHNFATPLIRYEIGDYAELGPQCSCGRGLPVLRRVLGRVRNMLVTASGERYWPTFGLRSLSEAAPVRQAQFVQKSHSLVEARLVLEAPLTAEQSARVRERVLERLPAGFELRVLSVDSIERGAGGKFEDFLSEIPRAEP